MEAVQDKGIHGLPGNLMKQFVEDNFDQNISSQNGKVKTHQIAGIEITPTPADMISDREKKLITRITKAQMSSPIQDLSEIETDLQFTHNKPAMREMPPSTINDEYRRRIDVSYSRANNI